jgi:hypothetical protein
MRCMLERVSELHCNFFFKTLRKRSIIPHSPFLLQTSFPGEDVNTPLKNEADVVEAAKSNSIPSVLHIHLEASVPYIFSLKNSSFK